MSDKVYEVPAVGPNAPGSTTAKYRETLQAFGQRSGRLLGANTASASTGSSPSPRSRTPPSTPRTSRSNGSKTASPMSRIIASIVICPRARNRLRSSGKATIPPKSKHITYAELHAAGRPPRQRAARAWRQEGRSRHDLSADDPGSRLRHARLRADRRDPFRRVRRLFADSLAGRIAGRAIGRRHHRRRGPARRAQGAAQGQCRRRRRESRLRQTRAGRQTHRRRRRLGSRSRRLAATRR